MEIPNNNLAPIGEICANLNNHFIYYGGAATIMDPKSLSPKVLHIFYLSASARWSDTDVVIDGNKFIPFNGGFRDLKVTHICKIENPRSIFFNQTKDYNKYNTKDLINQLYKELYDR